MNEPVPQESGTLRISREQLEQLPWERVDTCGSCGATHAKKVGTVDGVDLVKCETCGVVRFDRIVDQSLIYTDGYHTGEGEIFTWDFDAERDYQMALFEDAVSWIERLAPRGTIADVGGGLGYLAGAAQRRGWKATLVEPVKTAAEFAAREFGVETITAGAEALAGLGRTFDVVALSHVLEHFVDPRAVLDDVRAAIGPGGALFVEVPNYASASRVLEGESWAGWQAGQHVHHFTMRTLVALLESHGFTVAARDSSVPGWSGLSPSSYAHWLGLERALQRAVGVKRALLRQRTENTAALEAAAQAPITEAGGSRRIYGRVFPLIAKVEERAGIGANIRVLARPSA